MTSTNRGTGAAPRPRSSSGEDGPESFSTQIQRIATQRPPPPPGKGIAMMVIAVAVVLAVIWQMTWGSDMGPAGVIDDFHRDDPSKTAAPRPKGEAEAPPQLHPSPPEPATTPRRVVLEETGAAGEPLPVTFPGASIPVPEGLDARTAGRLRLNLNALAPDNARIVSLSAVRELPFVVGDAPEATRETVFAFVVAKLVTLLERPGLDVAALDAGLVLVEKAAGDLEPLVRAASTQGLARDRTAAAALMLLDALPAEARAAQFATVEALRDAEERPEHLRRLAARLLEDWDAP